MTFKFNMRDKVKDQITGFTGIITARTEWLNGCHRYNVQSPDLDKDGRVPSTEHFDEEQLDLVEAAPAPAAERKPVGGPKPDPKSSHPNVSR